MKAAHAPVHQIELRLVELDQLFNSMDPTPFHHRDLDRDAEQFLESWTLEFPQESRFRILVHIRNMPAEDPTPLVADAIHNYFTDKSALMRRNLRIRQRLPNDILLSESIWGGQTVAASILIHRRTADQREDIIPIADRV